jgi:hypothetical protein
VQAVAERGVSFEREEAKIAVDGPVEVQCLARVRDEGAVKGLRRDLPFQSNSGRGQRRGVGGNGRCEPLRAVVDRSKSSEKRGPV